MIKLPSIKAVALLYRRPAAFALHVRQGTRDGIGFLIRVLNYQPFKGDVGKLSQTNSIRNPILQPQVHTSREQLDIHSRQDTQQLIERAEEEPSQITRIQDLEIQLRDSKSREELYIDKREQVEQLVKDYVHGYSVSQNKAALTQVIQVYDLVKDIIDGISDGCISVENRLKEQVESLVMYLDQAITALGLEQIKPNPMSEFYAESGVELTEQVPTANVKERGKIAKVNHVGFRSRLPETDVRERYVVRPAKVAVYYYVPIE